jgi:hypothetical protein
MLLLARILGIWVLAALCAAPVFKGLRTGQINTRGGIIKKRRHPLLFWAILAVYLLFAVTFFAAGLGMARCGTLNPWCTSHQLPGSGVTP